jgi:Bacterial Ig-like domain (group 3)
LSDGSYGGAAKFATSTLASGTHTITATYNGNTSFDGSSASLTQTVN